MTSLSAASRLSSALADRYRIERELGAGGMATVYLAEDLKHDRKVAIKVLKPELAAVLGAERFIVEIKTTASLSHPHILPLFDSGSADGFLFYVMPYIDGETVRDKLNRETQFAVHEAIRIAREVADALDYAHRRGVIHRDIKPENILLHDGRAMVMDFGIALAVSAAAGARMTETGLSLGTPHYMSPEQATAEKDITPKSDIYSLGSVLYEMLTGNPPHTGANAQQVIMKIIAEQADPVTKYRRSVPPHVAAAVLKAIEKLPADRFDSAKSFAVALENPSFATATTQTQTISTNGWRWRAALPLAAVPIALAVALAWQTFKREPDAPVMRLDLIADETARVFANSDMVISPDGSMVAYAGTTPNGNMIFLRRLATDVVFRPVAGSEGIVGSPTFSPDGKWLAFVRRPGSEVVKIPIEGGTAVPLGKVTGSYPHWGTDNLISIGNPSSPITLARSDGSRSDPLPQTNGAQRYSWILPDGSGVIFSRTSGLFAAKFDADSAVPLNLEGVHPVYVPTGHLLFVSPEAALVAVPFDPDKLKVTGDPVRVVDGIGATVTQRGFSVSSTGTLIYRRAAPGIFSGAGSPMELVIGDLTTKKIEPIHLPRGRRGRPQFSPDGRRLAFEWARDGGGDTDIATVDLVSGTVTRLTFAGDNDDPTWSPDGKHIAFTRTNPQTGEDIFVKPADNSGQERLLSAQSGQQNPTSWFNADTILFQSDSAGQWDLFTYSLSSSTASPYLQAPWSETDLHVSRDGKLAAFTSLEMGTPIVWLRDFPVPNGKWQVSPNGGMMPRWSPDGKDIYYWRPGVPDSLFRVRIDRSPGVSVNTPQFVMAIDIVPPEGWDLHPDGKRFVVVQTEGGAAQAAAAAELPPQHYVVVSNWFAELRARAARSAKR